MSPVDVNENTIRIRQKDPSAFQQDSFRTIRLTAGVQAVIGRLKGETTTTVQSYLFDRGKFSEAEARAWVREHAAGRKKGADDDARFSVPIEKVDDEQRMVWGYASTPDLDSQGDRISLHAMADALEEYMRFANVREMHQPSAVGKVKSAEVDDVGLRIGAKIVDDSAWAKVKEGVYSAFSVGVRIVDRIDEWVVGLKLREISLVDRPANPRAVIDVWKSDAGDEPRRGGTRMNLKKWAGPEDGKDEDVVKLLDGHVAAVEKLQAEKTRLLEELESLKKQVKDIRSADVDKIALQAKVEKLEADIAERDEKEKAARRKTLLDGAIAAGKIKAAKRPDWEQVFNDSGETTCAKLLADMPVVVPIGQRVGSGRDADGKTAMERFEDLALSVEKEANPKATIPSEKSYRSAAKRNPNLFREREAESLNASRRQQMALVGGGAVEDVD